MTISISQALQQQIQQQLTDKLALANKTLQRDYPLPEWNCQQTGTTAGCALLQQWLIKLNPVLLLENPQAFIDQVIPHELAHLLTFAEYGRVPPHGKEWRYMMETILGVPAKRTHNFSLDNVKRRHYQRINYHCQCKIHPLTLYRHQRIVKQQVQYYCRQCKTQLQLAE